MFLVGFFLFSSEFCGQENIFSKFSMDSIPQGSSVDYILEHAASNDDGKENEECSKTEAGMTKNKTADSEDASKQKGSLVIFAVDVSGSMSATTEVPALQGWPFSPCHWKGSIM